MENGQLIGFDESIALRECRSTDYDLFNFGATHIYSKDRVLEMLEVSWCIDNPQGVSISGNYDSGTVKAIMLDIGRKEYHSD